MKPIDALSEEELAQLLRRGLALPDAPAALLRKAIGLWDTARPPSVVASAQALLKRVAAALSFDSWAAEPLPLGLRSTTSETRQLLFTALGRDIDLRIRPEAGGFEISGQVLGPDGSGRVELASQGEAGTEACAVQSRPLDEMGGFRLVGVERGRYALNLRFGDEEIVLPPIDVGERARSPGAR